MFVVSGRKVHFGVGVKTCDRRLALSLDACAVVGCVHGGLVVGCQAGRTSVCAQTQESHGG